MPRSIAELLPRPFSQLEVDDVEQLVRAAVGEDRETVFLELKQEPVPDKLAKSCAAFANSLGGLLVVGVDNDGVVVSCVRPSPIELSVWMKDILRPRVTPLPLFRVRWLETDHGADRGVLLVLVERSSTTPHLLVNLGAIYVRNPGSSDPVPVHDNRTLSDLVERGDRAREKARARVEHLSTEDLQIDVFPGEILSGEYVALVASGVSDGFEDQLFDAAHVRQALIRAFGDAHNDGAWGFAGVNGPIWTQHAVGFERHAQQGVDRWVGHLWAWDDGSVLARYARTYDSDSWSTTMNGLLVRIQKMLGAGRELLLDLGAHGDLLVGVRIAHSANDRVVIETEDGSRATALQAHVLRSASLSETQQSDAAVIASIHAELARSIGIGPPTTG